MDRKRAFGYVRVSEMRDEKWSPGSQRQAITKEAERLAVPLENIRIHIEHDTFKYGAPKYDDNQWCVRGRG